MAVKSHVKEFNRLLERATATGLKRAGVFYHAECRKAVNVPNTGQPRTRQRSTVAGPKGSQYTAYESPSQPGEPPHKITGTGQSSIVWESNEDPKDPRVRVGVAKAGIHMAYLELGTKRIKPRPWLVATLLRFWRQIGQLAATGGRREVP